MENRNLVRLTEDEVDLLLHYRHADQIHQELIIQFAAQAADRSVGMAEIVPLPLRASH